MMRMLESQAPAKQTATDTINTLSGRLSNATLLEDRRAAILGLRSFAKDFPASVASGSLRELIACLRKDAEDVDTIKVILETLLGLFNPNDSSPEAGDEIALWLADEFTQRQDNITTLLDLLETPDFYSRLYSLQLLQAISSARPERTQECVLTAPLGTPRLVAILDDPRDPVRVAGLDLLNDLSHSSTELQKLFVFENAFDRIFSLIRGDGSLLQGGPVVQDCLNLLANLLRFNTSNQTAFRETGGFSRCAALLPGPKKPKKKSPSPGAEEDDWVSPQSERNTWGLLAILRMLLVKGSTSTKANQTAFAKHGLLHQVLEMAFDPSSATRIKVEALNTCADIIRGNAQLQEGFAPIQVTVPVEPSSDGAKSPDGGHQKYIIEALLDLAIRPQMNESFDVRFAAVECTKAYFSNHKEIRAHFLNRAIDGHMSGEDETANILTTLMTGSHAYGSNNNDAYRIWFAGILMFHLIFDDREAKERLMSVSEGDAERGEEVVTCIQTLTGVLLSSLTMGEDDRIPIAYLTLLSAWLFQDAAAVNDFLGEASSFNSLVQYVVKPGNDHKTVVKGLCATLLGIIYEFSTKDSPVPRRKLQVIMTQSLGREKYLDTIARLRSHPYIRDFEVHDSSSGLSPKVFFDEDFVDFLKDNFSRLSRAIDRDPGQEQHESHEGIDRDFLDTLRGEIDEKKQVIEKMQADLLSLEQKLNQEQADHRRTQESSLTQLNTIKRINEDLHSNHDKDVRKMERDHKQVLLDLENRLNLQVKQLERNLHQSEKDKTIAVAEAKREGDDKLHEANKARVEIEQRLNTAHASRQEALEQVHALEQTQRKTKDELSTIQDTLKALRTDLEVAEGTIKTLNQEKSDLQSEIEKLNKEILDQKTKTRDLTWKVKDAEDKQKKAEKRASESERQAKETEKKVKESEKKVLETEEARQAAQTELDDLFILLGDLEEKRNRDKKRLKELGEEVSDMEDENDDDDDDDDDEDEDEDEEDEGVEEEAEDNEEEEKAEKEKDQETGKGKSGKKESKKA